MCPPGDPPLRSPAGSPPEDRLGRLASERLALNLERVRGRIARAAEQAGRDPGAVRLLAVTKSVGAPAARALFDLGQDDLGESRVQSLEAKLAGFGELPPDRAPPRWHLIGHLQRNKARRAARLVHAVHSIDSHRIAAALEEAAAEAGTRPRVYFELLLEPEGRHPDGGRTGLSPSELRALLERAGELRHLHPIGLMAMGPVPLDPSTGEPELEPLELQAPARRVFARLAELRDSLRGPFAERFEGGRIELSMGMSSDLEAAVQEGSDVVRVGSALFEGLESGERASAEGEAP